MNKRSDESRKRRRKKKTEKKVKQIKLAKRKLHEEKERQEAENKRAIEKSAIISHELSQYKVAYGKVVKKLKEKQFRSVSQTPFTCRNNTKVTASVIFKDDKFRFLAKKLQSYQCLSESVLELPECENVLGEGVFGKVVVGKFLTLNVNVAVKLGKHKSFSAQNEARILQHLSGNICFPYVFGVFRNMLVMELIANFDGQNYSPLTVSKKPDDGSIASHTYWSTVCLQLTNAIIFMHKKNILHNDIKGDNIYLRKINIPAHPD